VKQEITQTLTYCDQCNKIINNNIDNYINTDELDICNECSIIIFQEAINQQTITIDDIKEIITRGHYKLSAIKNNAILC
jgi:DNA replicative helicase MCM subunit Mcm2 (Cdc46/Mcm family)